MTDSTATEADVFVRVRSLKDRVGELADIVEGHFLACPEGTEDGEEVAALAARLRSVQQNGHWLTKRPEEDLTELENDVQRLCDAVGRHAELCS